MLLLTNVWSRLRTLNKSQAIAAYVILILVVLIVVQPVKNHAWNSIKARGDDALTHGQFDQAILNYEELHLIRLRSAIPQSLIDQAQHGKSDILSLRQFYIDRGDAVMTGLMDSATRDYPDPQTATLNCQTILKAQQTALARVCIDKTTSSWPNYRDGWITASVIAQAASDTQAADAARQKAIELDPQAAQQKL